MSDRLLRLPRFVVYEAMRRYEVDRKADLLWLRSQYDGLTPVETCRYCGQRNRLDAEVFEDLASGGPRCSHETSCPVAMLFWSRSAEERERVVARWSWVAEAEEGPVQ